MTAARPDADGSSQKQDRVIFMYGTGVVCRRSRRRVRHDAAQVDGDGASIPFDPDAGRVFLRSMNTVTSRHLPARPLALPNLLTYARIVAVPVVVACLYWQDILQGGLWLRWVALVIFIARRRDRRPRRLFRAQMGRAVDLRPHARSDRRQAAGRVLPADAGRRRHDPRLVAVGGDRDSVPRDPGLGPARVSRRAARQRAGHAARQMEDDAAARRGRLPDRGQGRRRDRAGGDADRARRCCGSRRC